MAAFDRISSPVLTMSPQPVHQGSLDRTFYPHPSASFGHPPSWTHSLGQGAVAPPRGRKRSRDEAAVNLDSPEKAPPAVEPAKESEDDWEYGSGMVLIKKSSGYVRDASSQSGTWLEEKAAAAEAVRKEEALLAQQRDAQDRPSLRSHKSSRLDLTARMSSSQDAKRTSPVRAPSDGSTMTPEAGGSQPIIDDFTLHLGIGWSRLSEDEHIQAAARGWARYIENHYPVTEPKILLESKGLESYLVEAREGYFLFGNDLHQGRLVSSDAQRALNHLKSKPPIFDGDHVIHAAGTPRPAEAAADQAMGAATASAVAPPATTTMHAPGDGDVDMN